MPLWSGIFLSRTAVKRVNDDPQKGQKTNAINLQNRPQQENSENPPQDKLQSPYAKYWPGFFVMDHTL
jgi:hypothetical protein